MTQAIYIGPGQCDPLSDSKRQIVLQTSSINGFDVVFPHHAETTPRLLSQLRACDLIIADLSLERPSVYFELGLASALGIRTILVASKGTLIHQIPAELSVTYYDDLADYEHQLSNSFKGHE